MERTKAQRIKIYVNKHNWRLDKKVLDIYITKPWFWKNCSKCESLFKREELCAIKKHVSAGIDSRGFSYTAYLCMNCAPTKINAHKIWFGEDYMKRSDPKWNWDSILA